METRTDLIYNIEKFDNLQSLAEQVVKDFENESIGSITLCRDSKKFGELFDSYIKTHNVKF